MTATIAGLGPVMQIAFVPRDFEATLAFWTRTMGVGPFFRIIDVKLEDVRYRGAPADIPFEMALAYWGDVQVELIRPKSDAPSIYSDWLAAGHEGLHHTCVLTDDMGAARSACAAAGAVVMQEARVPGGGEVIYVDTGGGPGTMVEILKTAPGGPAFFAMMRAAAKDWDGSDPVRIIG